MTGVPAPSSKRLDLQGIRGWAVLAVVTFHFFPSLLPFGYLGVDVFFVLSGFLIALVLSKKPPGQLVTYADFYFKRIRRIFPLFLLVILVCLICIVLLYEGNTLYYNTHSAVYALLFATNVKSQDEGEDYFRSLVQSDDLFTHTWSLAVEIQFYLIAPFIILLPNKLGSFSPHLHSVLIVGISAASFVFHVLVNQNLAFNSVFARLWQFLAGVCVFQINTNRRNTTDSAAASTCKNVALFLVLGSFAYFVAFHTNQGYLSRLGVTTATALLIHYETTASLLTHWTIVRLGGASYALYLIHWPVLCIFGGDLNPAAKLVTIAACIVLSIVVEKYYETWYLSLEPLGTVKLVVVIYALSFGVLYLSTPGSSTIASLEAMPNLTLPWEFEYERNVTIDDAIAINNRYEQDWATNLIIPNCTMRDAKESNPWGMCTMPAGTGKLKFLVVGNSYAANHIGLVRDHFRPFYSTLRQLSVIGCEAVVETTEVDWCEGNVRNILGEIEKEKPDVVFVIQAWINTDMKLEDERKVEQDPQYKEILDNVEAIGANVQKIFLMSSLPRVKNVPKAISDTRRMRLPVPAVMPEVLLRDDRLLRIRLEEVAKRCANCVLFDLMGPHLNREGLFEVNHPHTHISYFEHAKHHTPYGLRLVEPVFERMALNFEKLLKAKYPDNIVK